jgi:hypothetical protein
MIVSAANNTSGSPQTRAVSRLRQAGGVEALGAEGLPKIENSFMI